MRSGHVLSLVKNNDRIFKCTSAHIGERRDFHLTNLWSQAVLHKGSAQPLHQHVIDGPEVRGKLLGNIAGQEAQIFIRLQYRTGNDDPFHVLMNQRLRRFGGADPGFPASGFPGCKDELFTLDSIQVVRLSFISRHNWRCIAAVPRHANGFYAAHLHKRGDRFFFTLLMAT